jgi:PAS domain-containing protein
MFKEQFTDLQNACAFAEAIVNTVREPLVVLDQDLRVIAASRSFYRTFKVNPRRRMGYSKASRAAGKNLAGSRCDRGL